jgi:hypothetical protein
MVRVKAPDGRLCEIPDSQLEAAMADGAKFVSDYELSDLNQRTSMAARFFEAEQKRKRPRAFRLNRPRYR